MQDRILLDRESGSLTPLEATPYDAEARLQNLVSTHTDEILPGALIDEETPRRWLFVAAEMRVPGGDESRDRFLDHLLLDQDGVPTLVEVKQSRNPEVRRKVVGQMLDYAAYGSLHWDAAAIRDAFYLRCEADGEDAEVLLSEVLGEDETPSSYWNAVDANLKSGRLRLLFVADILPAELRQTIQFLNQVTDPTEVLGIEVKQYVGEGVRVYVPRVIGQPRAAKQRGQEREATATATAEQFDQEVAANGAPAVRAFADRFRQWAADRRLPLEYSGGRNGIRCRVLSARAGGVGVANVNATVGWLLIPLKNFRRRGAFQDERAVDEIIQSLEPIPGWNLRGRGFPALNLTNLDDAHAEMVIRTLDRIVELLGE